MSKNALTGKTVFITGASSGIGEALARRASHRGAAVALTARRADRLEALAAEIRDAGGRALPLGADVTRDGDLEAAAARTREAFGGIDVVIANAGFGVTGDFAELTLDDYRRQFDTNVFGVLRTAYATLDDLGRSKGSLVLIGSVAGYAGFPGTSAYAMSKAAVHSLSQALHGELAPRGVAVVLIAPGFVESEIRRVDNAGKLRDGAKDFVPAWLQMTGDDAAEEILDAAVNRERERVLTRHGKVMVLAQRHTPGIIAGVLDVSRRLARKKK